jgi:phosphoribosyl-AMP cyclohydrolase
LSGFFASAPDAAALEEGDRLTPKFDAAGLVTAVATRAGSGELLMVAHMNDEALRLTIETGVAHYWSRSRRALWKKGETSGQLQRVLEMRIDCDQDALWLVVEVAGDGGCCHTGRADCFYRVVPTGVGAEAVVLRRPV